MTRHATAADFVLDNGREFKRAAVYFPSMDYLDYVREDGVKVCERVDQFLSVIWNEDGEMIGFKIKCVRNFFLTKLKPALSLSDDDFLWVRDLFVALATTKGDEMFPEDNRREERKVKYRRALKIATDDQVRIVTPDLELMAA